MPTGTFIDSLVTSRGNMENLKWNTALIHPNYYMDGSNTIRLSESNRDGNYYAGHLPATTGDVNFKLTKDNNSVIANMWNVTPSHTDVLVFSYGNLDVYINIDPNNWGYDARVKIKNRAMNNATFMEYYCSYVSNDPNYGLHWQYWFSFFEVELNGNTYKLPTPIAFGPFGYYYFPPGVFYDIRYYDAPPIPIDYHWKSIKSLNLANIEDLMPYSSPLYQFEENNSIMLLSFIPDEYLNDGEPVTDGEHFTIKEPSLKSYITQFNDTTYHYKNLYLKTKKYAKLGRRISSSYNSFHFVFLSAIGMSPQITYYEKYIDVASVDGIPYLGFIIDEENHAAKLNIIFLKTTVDVLSGLEKKTVDFNTISMTDEEMSSLYAWLTNAYGYDESSEDTETNQPQGGDETDPVINTPLNPLTLPYNGAFKSGFVKLYEVTDTQLQSLCEYMWDTNFVNSLVRLFNDPRQIIIGIMVFPVTPSQKSLDVDIFAGNLNTGIKGNLLNQEYQTVDAGELRIPKGNADFMSFYPYRKIRLNIPYCGEHEIDPSAVYGATLRLYYHLSFFSGVCIAEVTRQFEGGEEEPMWFFGGQIAFDIPMSSEDFSRSISAIISAGATLGSSIASFATGNVVSGATKALGAVGGLANGSLSPQVGYSSGGGSTSGFLSTQQPYAIFETPITAFDGVQSNYVGNTYYKVVKLNDCTGFTKCFEAHIESVHATDDELEEINSWLTKGVLIRHDGNATPSDTPATPGNTVITFMKLSSERNTIGKKWTNAITVEGKLIYDQSYTEPSILVEQNVIGYNYAYIGLFGRFYFVNDVTIRKNNLVEVSLKSDPLQSFKDEIRNCYAAVERQKSDGNAFIDDPYRWTQVNKKVSITPFTKDGVPFDFGHLHDTYILIVAGK